MKVTPLITINIMMSIGDCWSHVFKNWPLFYHLNTIMYDRLFGSLIIFSEKENSYNSLKTIIQYWNFCHHYLTLMSQRVWKKSFNWKNYIWLKYSINIKRYSYTRINCMHIIRKLWTDVLHTKCTYYYYY